ncbi:MAG: hypothetical protein AAFR53_15715, partial [Pseudomonadota bacterium]
MNFKHFPNPSELEKELISKFPTGKFAGKKKRPERGDDTKVVRASLLRALVLDQIEGITADPKGLRLAGAFITEELELDDSFIRIPLWFSDCLFEKSASLIDANVPALYLPGCDLPHLNAERLRCKGDVQLTSSFLARDGVNFRGAEISGQLNCNKGTFRSTRGRALNCDAARIGGDVFLRNEFVAKGEVNFVRARIEGNLRFEKAKLKGAVSLEAARIGEGLFFREVTGQVSTLNLTDASAGVLRDDKKSWQDAVRSYRLQGFRYDRVDSDMRVRERIEWLETKHDAPLPGFEKHEDPRTQFAPQPYTWLASVLQKEGRRQGAVEVRFEREARLAQVAYDRVRHESPVEPWHDLRLALAAIRFGASKLSRLVFGYGYKPIRAFWTVAGIVTATALLYAQVYATGQMAPNSDVVLTSAD